LVKWENDVKTRRKSRLQHDHDGRERVQNDILSSNLSGSKELLNVPQRNEIVLGMSETKKRRLFVKKIERRYRSGKGEKSFFVGYEQGF